MKFYWKRKCNINLLFKFVLKDKLQIEKTKNELVDGHLCIIQHVKMPIECTPEHLRSQSIDMFVYRGRNDTIDKKQFLIQDDGIINSQRTITCNNVT